MSVPTFTISLALLEHVMKESGLSMLEAAKKIIIHEIKQYNYFDKHPYMSAYIFAKKKEYIHQEILGLERSKPCS
jgi:hypothetical protein